jgi:hypothetical protein
VDIEERRRFSTMSVIATASAGTADWVPNGWQRAADGYVHQPLASYSQRADIVAPGLPFIERDAKNSTLVPSTWNDGTERPTRFTQVTGTLDDAIAAAKTLYADTPSINAKPTIAIGQAGHGVFYLTDLGQLLTNGTVSGASPLLPGTWRTHFPLGSPGSNHTIPAVGIEDVDWHDTDPTLRALVGLAPDSSDQTPPEVHRFN